MLFSCSEDVAGFVQFQMMNFEEWCFVLACRRSLGQLQHAVVNSGKTAQILSSLMNLSSPSYMAKHHLNSFSLNLDDFPSDQVYL